LKKYALIGKTLGHSFSKAFFTDYFHRNSINASYSNLELSDTAEFLNHKNEFDGFNVTIPYKETIIPFLDKLNEEADEIGAVNTIKMTGGTAIGYNTDAYGFHQSIKPFLTNKHERALVLGTGGASKAVRYALEKIGIDVIFLSRNPSGSDQFSYNEANDIMISNCKLIVNTTPVGTYPNIDAKPPVDLKSVGEEHLVVDLIYNPEKTGFLLEAESFGATTMNGESMLKLQALKSYEIWNRDD
jgi:shikimate dehydrogenase